MKTHTVHTVRDAETGRWLTGGGGEIPGLVCETASFDELLGVISYVAPDLVHDNLDVVKGETFAARLSPSSRSPVSPPEWSAARGRLRIPTSGQWRSRNLEVGDHAADLHRPVKYS